MKNSWVFGVIPAPNFARHSNALITEKVTPQAIAPPSSTVARRAAPVRTACTARTTSSELSSSTNVFTTPGTGSSRAWAASNPTGSPPRTTR